MKSPNIQTIVIGLLCLATPIYAQPLEGRFQELKDTRNRLSDVDPNEIDGNWFLNRGFQVADQLDIMESLVPGVEGANRLEMSRNHFLTYWLGGQKSQLLSILSDEDPGLLVQAARTEDSVVPFGVLHYRGTRLSSDQMEDLLSERQLSSPQEKLDVFAASALKDWASGPDVTFDFSPSLYYVDSDLQAGIHVDFGDGAGFVPVKRGDRLVVSYPEPGLKRLEVRFDTPDGPVYVAGAVDVFWMPEVDIAWQKDLPVPRYEKMTGSPRILGGSLVAYQTSACDRVFNKPVIVIEGFDGTNKRGHPRIIQSMGQTARSHLTDNGYDIVTLNFAEGGASVQTNAKVLEQALAVVQAAKVGSHPISLLGVSMGGVVSRYALADMERRGISHQVGLFVAYDSPFLGANVPLALQKLAKTAKNLDSLLDMFNISIVEIDDALANFEAPFARQILRLRTDGDDSEFQALQSELQALGWPTQSRNVALVNGSSLGSRQSADYFPGDSIFEGRVEDASGIRQLGIRMKTPVLNGWSPLLSIQLYNEDGIQVADVGGLTSHGPFNYDMVPGGIISTSERSSSFELPSFLDDLLVFFNPSVTPPLRAVLNNYEAQGRDRFTFVPLFSALASTLPLDQQSDLFRSIETIVDSGGTPFDEVYATEQNTTHGHAQIITSEALGFLNNALIPLLDQEFPEPWPRCLEQTMPPAPPVQIIGPTEICPMEVFSTSFVPDEKKPFDIIYFLRHSWHLQKVNSSLSVSLEGNRFSLRDRGLLPGTYNLTLTRFYAGNLEGPDSSASTQFRILDATDPICVNPCPFTGAHDPGVCEP